MPIARTLLLAALGVVAACAASSKPSLVGELPEAEPDSFRFFHGSWIWPDSTYAFHLTEDRLYVADASNDPRRSYRVDADACPEIARAFAEMQAALATTARIAAGDVAVAEPSEIVMDGPDYRVEYWSRGAASTIELRGGGNSQLVAPWVDAALAVRALGEQCFGS